MKRYIIFLFIFHSFFQVLAQKVSVSLFNEQNLQTILVTPVKGTYAIVSESGNFTINPNQIIYLSRSGDSVKVRDMASHLGTWKRVSIVGQDDENIIRVNPISPSIPARIYDDNLGFYIDFNRLMLINIIDQDKYIAGVVEAESGPSAHLEFYKAQALLARTYAIGHRERHVGEGFNLCDEVHCQAYKGKSTKNPSILKATLETAGQVVIDSDNALIIGAFHANCGGETANSGDVWITNHNYLTTVTDNFCKGQPSSQWEVRIPIQEWQDFLKSKGVNVDALQISQYEFNPKGREYLYTIGGKVIPMTDIRSHFNLRSSFFTLTIASNNIRVKGRGYGHGVGLCQDGAMQMARRGKSYTEILQFYFHGVRVVNYSDIDAYSNNLFKDDDNMLLQ